MSLPKTNPAPSVGSISTGTLRPEDLLRSFSQELGRLRPSENNKLRSHAAKLIHQLTSSRKTRSAALLEEVDECIQRIEDELGSIAATAGLHFGSHPGDGADFGFWQPEDEGGSE